MFIRSCSFQGVLVSVLFYTIVQLSFSQEACCIKPLPVPYQVDFKGSIRKDKDLSAVIQWEKGLIVGSDEVNFVQYLERRKKDEYEVVEGTVNFPGKDELDIEGLTTDGEFVYVLGSHSRKRGKVKEEDDEVLVSFEENLKAILNTEEQEDRGFIYRFKPQLSDGVFGNHGEIESVSFLEVFKKESCILRHFVEIPSKENGIDLEGIAVKDGKLYLGFRGPVFRENYTPVMVTTFEQPEENEILFLNLNGRGIRDLVAVENGFLLIAGPMGDGPGTYQIIWWNGGNTLIGEGNPNPGKLKILGEFPHHQEGKAEGLVVLEEEEDEYEVIVLFDGLKDGSPRLYKIEFK
ncbi:Hypothetical protein PBC10988_7680 [Planctomycetales bacterium 10988]|nr:Hypothetical protein PBC10988_7680 [Planctomycetales bacterium 10988]